MRGGTLSELLGAEDDDEAEDGRKSDTGVTSNDDDESRPASSRTYVGVSKTEAASALDLTLLL